MQKRQLIKAENTIVRFGDREILNFEKFSLYEGERVGLVGVNGSGKTTLLRVLSGELEPDCGIVQRTCEVHFFKQLSDEIDSFALDAREVSAMGVRDKIWQEKVSGGEDTRIRLAQMFGSRSPLLFLDEPTTNLDMAGIETLTRRLQKEESVILVSHDQALLNAVCTRIVEIADGKLNSFDGNYDTYLALKQAAKARQQVEYEQYTREKKRLEQVYYAKKEKAKSVEKKPKGMSNSECKVRSKMARRKFEDIAMHMERGATNVLKRIEHMEVKEKPRELPRIRPDFRLTDPPGNRVVIRGEHIRFSYENGAEIFRDANFQIPGGRRVALLGENGAGKTTLLKLIKEGACKVVPKASLGFFDQDLSSLDYEKTVLENVMAVSVQKEEVARTILARLLFSARDMTKKAGVLSGGERIKLCFARLLVDKINVLILDEPTNYLDIMSVTALQEIFAEYEGTLLFVSHDEAFIRAVATDILVVKDKKVEAFLGTPEEYFEGKHGNHSGIT